MQNLEKELGELLTIRIDKETQKRIEEEAIKHRITRALYLRMYIENMIEKHGLLELTEKRA